MYQKIISTLVVMAIAIFGYLACTGPQSNGLDILILNGKIVNGTGNPWFYGDAGIKDNTIIAIRDLSNQTAALVIDAEGFIVSPGFIDMHTHCDDYGLGEPSSKGTQLQRQSELLDSGSYNGPDRKLRIRDVQDRRNQSGLGRAGHRNQCCSSCGKYTRP